MPYTTKARFHGVMQCDQACGTHVYSVKNDEGKTIGVFNAVDDSRHDCPTAQTARLFQYKFNMVYGRIIDGHLEKVENAISELRAELDKEIQNNVAHAHEFEEWKEFNRQRAKIRKQS